MTRHSNPSTRRAALALTLGFAACFAHAQALAQPVSPAPVVSYEYDAQGNRTRVVQAPGVPGFGFATAASYDALQRPVTSTNARAGVTQLGYNGRDELTQVVDPRSLITGYQRNGLGQLIQTQSTDSGVASQTFDAAGNLKTRQDARGALATFSYDALNRLTGAVYAGGGGRGRNFTWVYDQTGAGFSNGIGRLSSTTHPGGFDRYAYDAWGRLVSQTTGDTESGAARTTAYEYDAAGNVTALTYPSGRKLLIAYTNGQPSAMSLAPTANAAAALLISGIQWQPFGPARSWQWAMNSGVRLHERSFDVHGRIVRYPLGNLVRDLSYDAADRITTYTHFNPGTGAPVPAANQSFAYDELGRLTGVATTGWNSAFGYEANGNRTAAALNGVANAYTSDTASNRLLGVSNPARGFGYDAAGNAVSDTGAIPYTATYDASNRLDSVTSGTQTTTYGYNAQGQRVSKVVQSSGVAVCSTLPSGKVICVAPPQTAPIIAQFTYDQQGRLLGEYNGFGQAIQEFIWLGDTPIAVAGFEWVNGGYSTVAYFIHADHLDTPRHITDRAGNIRWSWDAEPFGAPLPNENPAGLGAFKFNLRFPGQYFDVESGKHYNTFRDYDASVGRYVQSDPIGLAGGINTYSYVGGNPISFVDPTGLDATVCLRQGAGGFGHVGIAINNGTNTVGFYPPGGVQRDTKPIESCKKISTTPEQDKAMSDAIKLSSRGSPSDYSLLTNNCVNFVHHVLTQGNMSLPAPPPRPRLFFESLPGTPTGP